MKKKQNKVVIACHHKSGTVLSRRIFSKISKHLDTGFNSWGKNEKLFKKFSRVGFNVLTHSSISQLEKLSKLDSELKFVHLIRNPKAMLCSTALYHKTSDEKWLHLPKKQFDGKTYSEIINGLSIKEALKFELERNSNITEMIEVDEFLKANSEIDSYTVKLEDMSHDKTLKTYLELLLYLGFDGFDLLKAMDIMSKNSLWHKKNVSHQTLGATNKLIPEFDKEIDKEFEKKYQKAADKMGY